MEFQDCEALGLVLVILGVWLLFVGMVPQECKKSLTRLSFYVYDAGQVARVRLLWGLGMSM